MTAAPKRTHKFTDDEREDVADYYADDHSLEETAARFTTLHRSITGVGVLCILNLRASACQGWTSYFPIAIQLTLNPDVFAARLKFTKLEL